MISYGASEEHEAGPEQLAVGGCTPAHALPLGILARVLERQVLRVRCRALII